jgi:hypothetical protein
VARRDDEIPGSSLPDVSRGDLDRVIRRAVELQFEDGPERTGSERLDEKEVLRIAGEVGIEQRFVVRALGELRAERLLPAPLADPSPLVRFFGEATAQAHRVVPGTLERVDGEIGEHLRTRETLSPVRSRRGQSLWEPHPGVMAELKRSFRFQGHRYELSRVNALHVTISPMEEGFVLVCLAADLRKSRAENATGWAIGFGSGGAVAGVGTGLLVGTVVLGIPALVAAPLFAVPATLAGVFLGLRVGRGPFRKVVERVRQAAEGILDELEG